MFSFRYINTDNRSLHVSKDRLPGQGPTWLGDLFQRKHFKRPPGLGIGNSRIDSFENVELRTFKKATALPAFQHNN
jgi:hypothetical protein